MPRIPREFVVPDEAVLHKEGGRLIYRAVAPVSLFAVLAPLQPLDEEFFEIADLPADPVHV